MLNDQVTRRSILTSSVAVAGAAMLQTLNTPQVLAAKDHGLSPAGNGATPVMIDDFTTGPYQFGLDYRDPTPHGIFNAEQTGASIAGGTRRTRLTIHDSSGANPRLQPTHVDMGSGYLNIGGGPANHYHLQLTYGHPTPMDKDISECNAIQLDFDSMHALVYVNFYLFSSTTDRLDYGFSFSSHAPVTQTIQLADCNPVGNFDKQHLNYIHLGLSGLGAFSLQSVSFV